jgi:hypothetical protein
MANEGEHRAPGATSPSALLQRRTVLLVALIVFFAAFLLFSGGAWAIALHGLLTDGGLAVLWLLSAAGIGSLVPMPGMRCCERLSEGVATPEAELRDTADAPAPGSGASRSSASGVQGLRIASAVALGLGVISLLMLGLGLAGWLNRLTAWAIVLLGLVALCVRVFLHFDVKTIETRLSNWLRADAGHAWLWLPAIVTLALACAAAMALPGLLWNMFGDPLGYDVVEYHLQVPREWYEAGRIVPLRHNAFSFFPFNVEMHYLLAMHLRGGPWAGMYLAQLMHVGFVATTLRA